MIVSVSILFLVVPFFLGGLVRKILDFQKANGVENYLCGWLSMIALSGVIQLLLLLAKRPFSNFIILYPAIIGILFVVGVVIFIIEARQGVWTLKRTYNAVRSWFRTRKSQIFTVLVLITFLIGIVQIIFGNPLLKGDFTLETIHTTLETNSIYKYNSLTGMLIEEGMPIRKQMLTLPIFFSFLTNVMEISSQIIIYKVIPCILLLLTYLVYGLWAGILFPNQRETQSCFLFLIGILLNFGTYSQLAPASLMFYQGFTGEAFVACFVLPITIYFMMKKQWILALLCVVAEAFLIWTTYGLGFSAITIAVFALANINTSVIKKKRNHGNNDKRKA